MIWYFLAGMIAGAVGWSMFCKWAARKIRKRKQMETPRDVVDEMLHTLKTKEFESGKEAIEYVASMNKRMDDAIERAKEDKTHD